MEVAPNFFDASSAALIASFAASEDVAERDVEEEEMPNFTTGANALTVVMVTNKNERENFISDYVNVFTVLMKHFMVVRMMYEESDVWNQEYERVNNNNDY